MYRAFLGRYVPGLSSDPACAREYRWGWRRQGRYTKTKLQKTASVIAVEPLTLYQNTHKYFLLAALILPKCYRG
jgi:hypothetical protein